LHLQCYLRVDSFDWVNDSACRWFRNREPLGIEGVDDVGLMKLGRQRIGGK